MPKYGEAAGKVFWMVGILFVAVLTLGIGWSILDNLYPELLRNDPVPPPQVKREVFMPPLRDVRLVLDRDEVRNPGHRVKDALKECIGSPPALVGTWRGTEAMLADASETDVFYFYCSSPESWKMLAGRAGLVKVHEGKPVDELVFFMN